MFRVLGRNPLEAAGLGRGNAAHFSACGESVYSTNECIEIILILSNIPVQVCIAWLETLQFGVDGG